jgi:molecular chaperone DnaJ
MFSCYYKILGLSSGAGTADIKKAFRELALRWHPDRNPQNSGAAARFRKILEAYETLIHPGRRYEYDRRNGSSTPREAGPPAAEVKAEEAGYRDTLEEFFGFRVRNSRVQDFVRSDLRFDLQIPATAIQGGTYESIDYQRLVYCQECLGTGSRGKATHGCCLKCGGQGELVEERSVRVWVPPGTGHGSRLRVPAGGDQLRPGIPAGDLVILVYLVDAPASLQDSWAQA